eukprot:CAMPEP_0202809804 /NCGR_PEP_ID=MMETSP1389-20130828/2026_1 /ASSEMBLY_ACC=CAM_ASM_000865 /TAXON_ID=302021 /ORGANISM="Rhodomonas sp., Strain CCMP768" /LENGTH=148 /DNA_ID=CAMNT_0049480509 /DNA_START=12 /DNA_END=458 /DNA_ORIENTATION=-
MQSYGAVELGQGRAAGSARRSKLTASLALSLLAVAAVALAAVHMNSRVVLESEQDMDADSERIKLDKMGLNLDHWPWDKKPPVNHQEEKGRMQSLVNRKNILIKEWETEQHKLYRHGYDDKYSDQPQVVSIGDVIKHPNLLLDTDNGQ